MASRIFVLTKRSDCGWSAGLLRCRVKRWSRLLFAWLPATRGRNGLPRAMVLTWWQDAWPPPRGPPRWPIRLAVGFDPLGDGASCLTRE